MMKIATESNLVAAIFRLRWVAAIFRLRRLKPAATLTFLCFPLLSTAFAGEKFGRKQEGTASGQFLKLAIGARAAAMGEAYSAVADDASSIYWNPAGLSQIPSYSATFMHAEYTQKIFFDFAGFGMRIPNYPIAWGIGLQYLNAGPILATDISGKETGYFHPNDFAISLGIAAALDGAEDNDRKGLALGGTLKFVRSKITTSAQTLAMDVGMLSPCLWDERIRFSAGAQNLIGRLRFVKESDKLPVSFKIGGRLNMSKFWIVSVEGVYPNDTAIYGSAGTEMVLPLKNKLRLALRGGITSRGLDDIKGFSGISFGMGVEVRPLRMPPFSFDYALVPLGHMGQAHRVSLTLNF